MLSDNQLMDSTVVANNRMNRLRGFKGVNSYEKDLKHDLTKTILAYGGAGKTVNWLDVGCGAGKALMEAGKFLETHYPNLVWRITGLDLVDMFLPIESESDFICFEDISIHLWQPIQTYQLITAVHSFHYFGDKLGVLTKLLACLAPDGFFIGQVDLSSIYIDDISQENMLATCLRRQGLEYHKKTKILKCKGTKNLYFPYTYLGADDQAGANYTGQEAVRAFYSK